MSTLTGADIAELRVYDDPAHPETSPYRVALPLTVPEAVLDPNTGEKLSDTLRRLSQGGGAALPTGLVSFFAQTTAPDGWLACNGSAVSRTTYAALFAAIGTRYGVGDGFATFNLPDLRQEFVRGWDGSVANVGVKQTESVQSHKHGVKLDVSNNTSGLWLSTGGPGGLHVTGSGTSLGDTESTGGTETRPRNIALLICIKT